jgi:hypothetical protein
MFSGRSHVLCWQSDCESDSRGGCGAWVDDMTKMPQS